MLTVSVTTADGNFELRLAIIQTDVIYLSVWKVKLNKFSKFNSAIGNLGSWKLTWKNVKMTSGNVIP